jgi:hypothetical protein
MRSAIIVALLGASYAQQNSTYNYTSTMMNYTGDSSNGTDYSYYSGMDNSSNWGSSNSTPNGMGQLAGYQTIKEFTGESPINGSYNYSNRTEGDTFKANIAGIDTTMFMPENDGQDPRIVFNGTVEGGEDWWADVIQSQNGDSTLVQMREKFFDYFSFGLHTYNVNEQLSEPECQVDSECDQGMFTKCCAKAVMFDPATSTKDVIYRCMNRGLVQGNVAMTLGDFNLEMKCQSSAAKLFGGLVAVSTLAALTVF